MPNFGLSTERCARSAVKIPPRLSSISPPRARVTNRALLKRTARLRYRASALVCHHAARTKRRHHGNGMGGLPRDQASTVTYPITPFRVLRSGRLPRRQVPRPVMWIESYYPEVRSRGYQGWGKRASCTTLLHCLLATLLPCLKQAFASSGGRKFNLQVKTNRFLVVKGSKL